MAVDARRVVALNGEAPAAGGRFVLYWMQQAQRAACNHALRHAVDLADARGLGVVATFGLTDGYPEANLRSYAFMLEGLKETAQALEEIGVRFVLRRGDPAEVAVRLAREEGASSVVCDRGHTRLQRAWRARVAAEAGREVVEVESDLVVPAHLASDKAEVGARTLRPRLARLRDGFLRPLEESDPRVSTLALGIRGDLDPADVEGGLAALSIDRSVPRSPRFRGGTSQARARLDRFLAERLAGYAQGRNEPAARHTSELSPYLQFGQISPVEVALRAAAAAADAGDPGRASFLDELIVRRELAHNHLWHRPGAYDSLDGVPGWALATLDRHRRDPRPRTHDEGELEAGLTRDPYYNAAMREMRLTGFMHNHMRMYWGKRILELTRSPEEAFAVALRLNNKHFLCGRGANAFANVGWVFGLHDRPWAERPVFGQVRYMNAAGLERKFDIAAYVRWAEGLEG